MKCGCGAVQTCLYYVHTYIHIYVWTQQKYVLCTYNVKNIESWTCMYMLHTIYIYLCSSTYMYIHVHDFITVWTCTCMSVPCSDTYVPFCLILSRWSGFQMYDNVITLLWHYYNTIMRSVITSIMTQGIIMTLFSHYYNKKHYNTIITLLEHHYATIMTILWLYYHTIMTVLSLYYDIVVTVLYILWRDIGTPFIGMCRQQSFTWARGNYN